jgi:hypothetical protein
MVQSSVQLLGKEEATSTFSVAAAPDNSCSSTGAQRSWISFFFFFETGIRTTAVQHIMQNKIISDALVI